MKTRKEGNNLNIRVSDNGPGIPQENIDKIFNPFFTTKSTDKGTGLGLSLSHDIICKHGGEMKVGAADTGGAEFNIKLPISASESEQEDREEEAAHQENHENIEMNADTSNGVAPAPPPVPKQPSATVD